MICKKTSYLEYLDGLQLQRVEENESYGDCDEVQHSTTGLQEVLH